MEQDHGLGLRSSQPAIPIELAAHRRLWYRWCNLNTSRMYPGQNHDCTPKLLSVFVPLYNEAEFIQIVLERIIRAPLPAGLEREIIVVDDASTDGSAELVEDFAARYPGFIRLIRCPKNRGKGAAIRTAI